LTFARSSSGYKPTRARDAHSEHCVVVRAIADQDPDGAERAIRIHLEQSLASVLSLV
jgi:DNA-binding GntR family transcriptional regulator